MIVPQIQQVFVQRSQIVKQQNIARRNYKVGAWLKLLALHRQNNSMDAIDQIIRNQIHEHFVLFQAFWDQEADRRIKEETSRENIDLLMLGLQDGLYFDLAKKIADAVLIMLKKKKVRENYCLSLLQKMVTIFSGDKRVRTFFKIVRQIYRLCNSNPSKVRSNFERQMRLAHDDFDLVWDQYSLWQSQKEILQRNKILYEQAKKKWQKVAVQFDENICSEFNIRQSLFNLQNLNEREINQEKYLFWVEKLQTQNQKLWFLRRMALNYKQIVKPYLLKVQQLNIHDQQTVIKKYKAILRLLNQKDIETKYISFLARRLNKHLLNEPLADDYNDNWSKNVIFFREQILHLIQKPRPFNSQQQNRNIYKQYYKLWIEVEQKIIRDKDSVSQLYENYIKDFNQLEEYQSYANSLLAFGALKDAKNVLKRYVFHAKDAHSREVYSRFIDIYGTVEDQIDFSKEIKHDARGDGKPKGEERKENVQEQQISSRSEVGKVIKQSKNEIQPSSQNAGVDDDRFKRQRPVIRDETDNKIYESTRKKLHVDSDCTVFLKGIPTNWKQSDVLAVLNHPQKVNSVRMVIKNNQQKDYCYIQFQNKQDAEKQVQTNQKGYVLHISRPPSSYDESNTLFVCALPQSANQQKIKNIFGGYADHISEIRLKLEKDKNYAYVQFGSEASKNEAFEFVRTQKLVIDGKKILVQHCDSNRNKNKKFIPVVFIKNLSFKAKEDDIRRFFEGKQISKLSIPINAQGKTQGFAYVQFEKFKDYQDALDIQKGSILGREVQILRSDREIHDNHRVISSSSKKQHQQGASHSKSKAPKGSKSSAAEPQLKDNSYFSSLFK